jgi:hypothetical protein
MKIEQAIAVDLRLFFAAAIHSLLLRPSRKWMARTGIEFGSTLPVAGLELFRETHAGGTHGHYP